MFSSFSSYLVRRVAGLDQEADKSGYSHLLLRVASAKSLSASSATMELPHGQVNFSWVREGGLQADKVALGYEGHLNCGTRGGKIMNVAFASFGTPSAHPKSTQHLSSMGVEDDTCHAASSRDVVEEACLGRAACTITASADHFFAKNDTLRTCRARGPEQPLRLWVQAQCSQPASLSFSATVPVLATARVLFPVARLLESVPSQIEGKAPMLELASFDGTVLHRFSSDPSLWQEPASLPVNSGVRELRFEQQVDGDMLSVSVGSGKYEMTLSLASEK
jgi:hypothetical protein